MNKKFKHQLTLNAIIILVMGCNNTPNAQQASNQINSDQNTISESTPKSAVNIQQIDLQIADLEKQEYQQISNEILFIQDKIANLEKQEAEISESINKLESKLIASSSKATVIIAGVQSSTKTDKKQIKREPSTNITTNDPQSVFNWGDWENGIQPAAGSTKVISKKFNINTPTVNFRPNEHAAFTRILMPKEQTNIIVVDPQRIEPPEPIQSDTAATGDPRARGRQ